MTTKTNIISAFHTGERGSAMTEFIIGLPIFILIFGGMGGLYKLNAAAIDAKMEVNATLWAKANIGAPAAGVTPITGGISSSMGGWSDLAQNGGSTLGIYADSYIKTLVPLTALGAVASTRPPSGCFTLSCGQIGLASNYFARPLLDDNAVAGAMSGLDFSGWASGISTVLNITGSRPAVAAGIRYGAVRSDSVSRTVSLPMWGSYTMDTGDLQVPGITDPTQRSIAVALTRLQFGTKDIWHSQIPEFNDEFTFDTGEEPSMSSDCQDSVSQLEACQASPPVNPLTGQPDASLCDADFDGGACSDANEVPGFGDISADWCTPGVPGC